MDDLRLTMEFRKDEPEPGPGVRHRVEARLDEAIATERSSLARRRHSVKASPARGRRRGPLVWGLSTAGTAAVLAGVALGVMAFSGGGGPISPDPAYAAEAVRKAAVSTTAAAESGVVETVLSGLVSTNDGEQAAYGAKPEMAQGVILSRTFAWNGEDLSISTSGQEGPYELRYVSGQFYEKGYFVPDSQTWFHRPDLDNGGGYRPNAAPAAEAFVPGEWLATYQAALVGSGLMDLITEVSGLKEVSSGDGGTTYTGTLPATELSTDSLALSGLLFASQPLDKLGQLDSAALVAAVVVVGSNGLIERAKLSYELEGSPFTYQVSYSQLGSAPAVDAPDAAGTTTEDSPSSSVPLQP
ncbi:MAG: hypothetical protein JXA57_17370 [Armatimonadetes bacterium]|nr:hypothetical protein [Armatimonadota bacterium]